MAPFGTLLLIATTLYLTNNQIKMDFKIKYIVQVDKDTNMFQRKDFQKLISQLRVDEDGNHLEKVDFQKSKIKNLDLSGLDLSNFDFSESNLKNINFSNCVLNKCNFEKASLNSCNFSSVRMRTGSLFRITAHDCNFSNAYLSSYLKLMVVENCDFSGATFSGLMTGVDFSSCKLDNYKTDGHLEMSGLIFPNED